MSHIYSLAAQDSQPGRHPMQALDDIIMHELCHSVLPLLVAISVMNNGKERCATRYPPLFTNCQALSQYQSA